MWKGKAIIILYLFPFSSILRFILVGFTEWRRYTSPMKGEVRKKEGMIVSWKSRDIPQPLGTTFLLSSIYQSSLLGSYRCDRAEER